MKFVRIAARIACLVVALVAGTMVARWIVRLYEPHSTPVSWTAVSTSRAMAGEISTSAKEAADRQSPESVLDQIGVQRGVCAVIGLPGEDRGDFPVRLAQASQLIVYFQSVDAHQVEAVRRAAAKAALLGDRVVAACGSWNHLALADNVADAVVVTPAAADKVAREEVLRILRPQAKALLPDGTITKPQPEGSDSWSHPYYAPDNNPQSHDQLARWPAMTQFLADPLFCPMPEVSVAAGGKVYRAFGHIAHKRNQNAMLNTLICANAYNGTVLWTRPLREGFMIHRNTMIATPEALYLADDQSCKLLDPDTGKVLDEIVVPSGLADGPVWKWMALVDGVLYAMVGHKEVSVPTQRSDTRGLGHWPWGMWPGHDYANPKTNFAFGRTFLALDPKTKKVLWSHREDDYLDGRAVCMGDGKIFFYCPEKFLGCIDAASGKLLWKTDDRQLLDAIGPNQRAQLWATGYSTTCYLKYAKGMLFFAGPQRQRLVVVSARDGKLLWQKGFGNYQLVLRDEGIYAAGPQTEDRGCVLDYRQGTVLARLPMRRACTRATGSVDSVFYRAPGGTTRIDVATGTAQHIAPMRPPCHDGVIIANGHFYWGPWMCGCQLSLYGHIALAPVGDHPEVNKESPLRFVSGRGDWKSVQPLKIAEGDWPTRGGDPAHRMTSNVPVPEKVEPCWSFSAHSPVLPTAPVTAGGLVFVADRSGAVRALDAKDGTVRWTTYTGGPVYFPPCIEDGRAFVGSADGRVYALEAATGRLLWSFRLAPHQRRIPVYGKLLSTWPVAGGVLVRNGVVYAAAGITHYDGTYVAALDAATGKVLWLNGRSGDLSKTARHGVSLQGELWIENNELRFLGGGVVEVARYDLQSGGCLNRVSDRVGSQFHTAFWAYYPDYAKYVPLDYTLPDGRTLRYDVTYEGSMQRPLALLAPLAPGQKEPRVPISRWPFRGKRSPRKAVWQDRTGARYHGFIVTPEVLVAAGQTGPVDSPDCFLAALRIDDGSVVWKEKLPAQPVRHAVATDAQGRIYVSLVDGSLRCFAKP